LTLILPGCAPAVRNFEVSVLTVEADLPGDFETVFEHAQEVLRQNRFTLDRLDRRSGIVTTLPVTSQGLFEFWRHDVDTSRDLWESSLNPIRRWVEVSIRPRDDDATLTLDVTVHKERFSSPDRQFTSSGAAYQFFGENLPSTQGMKNVAIGQEVWMDVGRDPAMESYLLTRMLDRAGWRERAIPAADADRL
jgi:hypothetical protein